MKPLITCLVLLSVASCNSQNQSAETKSAVPEKDYTRLLTEINQRRVAFNSTYASADSAHRHAVVEQAREYLTGVITQEMFPQWYGTPWDFNGTTRTPGHGFIACGYFVTTVLNDAGFRIPRVKWAQSASEVFIRRLSPKNQIARFSNKTLPEVESYLVKSGNGIYVAGLDSHVGFLVVDGSKVNFVHANYYQRFIGVMSEDIHGFNPFAASNYRVIGKLMSDEMILNWMNGISYN